MTRSVEVFVGKKSAQTQFMQVQLDNDVFPGQPDSWVVDTFAGPQQYLRAVDDDLNVTASGIQVVETNLFNTSVTNNLGLSHPVPTVSKTGPQTNQVIFGTSMEDAGFSGTANKWDFYRNTFGKINCYRNYSSGGALSRFSSNGDLQQMLNTPSCKRLYITHKGASNSIDPVTGLTRWSASDLDGWWGDPNFPAENSGTIIYLGWWHEPVEDFTTDTAVAQYRLLQEQLCDYVHANGPTNVKVAAPCWQGALFYGSTGQAVRSPQSWFPGRDAQGVPRADYVSLDTYSRPGRATATDTSEGHEGYMRFSEIFNTSTGNNHHSFINEVMDSGACPSRTGRWICGEFASANVGDPNVTGYSGTLDPTDIRRANWIRNTIGPSFKADRTDIEAILWWSASGNKGDFRLWTTTGSNANPDADPATDAWRDLMAETAAAFGW